MNYYSLESDQKYMSCSQYDRVMRCESEYLNYISGKSPPTETNPAFLLGNYVHTYFESPQAHEKFKEENSKSIYTAKGTLRAEFQQAETMIETLKNDKFAMFMLEGEKEKEFFGELFGVKWKCKLDVWNAEKNRIVDIKTTKNIYERTWRDGEKLNFIELYNYPRRAAVYSEIVRQNVGKLPGFYIVAISKEAVPDKAIIKLTDPERWEVELSQIQANLERIKLVKEGKVEPIRCEHCNYCRSTKQISKIISYKEL